MKKSELKQIIREEIQKAQQKVDIYKNNYIKGIKNIIRDNPEAQNFVGKELLKLGKERLNDLSSSEAQNLNIQVIQNFGKSQPSLKPTQDVDPYILGKGKGYMGATYTGD